MLIKVNRAHATKSKEKPVFKLSGTHISFPSMKIPFVSSLGLVFSSIVNGKIIQSSDGTDIFASAIGNSENPPIVFVHGFTLSALVFDNLFKDERLLDHFYLVCKG